MANKAIVKKIWLKNNEKPIMVIRRSKWCWSVSWLLALLLSAGACFFMPFLLIYGYIGVMAVVAVVVVAVIIFLRAYLEYYYTAWVLTDLRVVDIYQKGFFHQEKSETVYDQIKEAYSRRQGWGSILKLGDLYLTLADEKSRLRLSKVRGYERALSEITLQQENYRQRLSGHRHERAEELLLRIKNKVGEKKFQELIGD
jgi:hypothetical protein